MFFQINVNLPCFALFVIVFVLFWYLFSLVEKKKRWQKKPVKPHEGTICTAHKNTSFSLSKVEN